MWTLVKPVYLKLKNTLLSVKETRCYHNIKGIFAIGILIIIIAMLAIYIWNNRDVFQAIAKIEWPYIGYLALFTVVINLVVGLKNKIFLEIFNVRLLFKEWFGLRIVSFMTNQLVPFQGGGMTLSAVYLKKKHQFLYSAYASVSLASYHLSFLISSLLGVIVVGILYLRYRMFNFNILIFFLAVFFGMLFLFFLLPSISPTRNRFKKIFRSSLNGWRRIKSDQRLISKISFLIVARILLQGLRFYFGYKALSLNVSYYLILLLAIINEYTSLIRITPGNIGIREAVIASVSKVIGVGFNEGLLLGVLLRGINLIFAFTLGPLFSYLLTKEVANLDEAN